MVLLIAGQYPHRQDAAGQRVLEERGWPYLSLDHLKMGLIRSGLTSLTPDSPDKELTALLWPVAREMIKTAIENGQNLVVEGCYIPCDFTKDFVPYYLDQLRAIWLIFSRRYIWERFDQILAYGGAIERRLDRPWTGRPWSGRMRRICRACQQYGHPYVLIDREYEIDLEKIL